MKIILNHKISITLALLALTVSLSLFAFAVVAPGVAFADLADDARQGVCDAGGGCSSTDVSNIVVRVINILSFAVGILSVIMILVGAIRYIVSAGDAGAAQNARNTILYAIIGLVIAFAAWGIVNFVTDLFT